MKSLETSPPSYNELGGSFAKEMWKGLVLSDYLKDIQCSLKAVAVDPLKAQADFEKLWRGVMHAVEHKPKAIWKELRRVAVGIKKIPLKRRVAECPRVLIVGEIYVRRDDFAVGELTDLMSERGIVVKVAGVSEWIVARICLTPITPRRKHDLLEFPYDNSCKKCFICISYENGKGDASPWEPMVSSFIP